MYSANYGIIELLKNVFYVCYTQMSIPGARMIRLPIILRGKRYIDFGLKLTAGARCRFEVHGIHNEKKLIFGQNVNLGYDVRITCLNRIEIGNNVLIGSRVLITDNSHGKYSGKNQDSPHIPPNKRELTTRPVKIEDNVWIGEGAVIQKGVTIGYGSIIAANSVITQNIPEFCIVGGVPGRVIKKFDKKKNEWYRVNE